MRRLTLILVVALLAAACSDSADTTTTTAAAGATTATTQSPTATEPPATTLAPPTTQAPTAPTLTWTAGSECVYSGPDTFPKGGEIVKFTYRNDSSVLVALYVSPGPGEALSRREVDPDTELTNTVIFRDAGDLALLCEPGPGQFVEGGLITVEETTTVEAAPTGPGNDELTFEYLIGTWRGSATGSFLQLNEDGTYRIAISAEDVENTTVEQGQFTLEGTLFTLISNEDSSNCEAGQRGSYQVEVLEDGPSGEDRMKQIQVEDECSTRGSVGDVTLERRS